MPSVPITISRVFKVLYGILSSNNMAFSLIEPIIRLFASDDFLYTAQDRHKMSAAHDKVENGLFSQNYIKKIHKMQKKSNSCKFLINPYTYAIL